MATTGNIKISQLTASARGAVAEMRMPVSYSVNGNGLYESYYVTTEQISAYVDSKSLLSLYSSSYGTNLNALNAYAYAYGVNLSVLNTDVSQLQTVSSYYAGVSDTHSTQLSDLESTVSSLDALTGTLNYTGTFSSVSELYDLVSAETSNISDVYICTYSSSYSTTLDITSDTTYGSYFNVVSTSSTSTVSEGSLVVLSEIVENNNTYSYTIICVNPNIINLSDVNTFSSYIIPNSDAIVRIEAPDSISLNSGVQWYVDAEVASGYIQNIIYEVVDTDILKVHPVTGKITPTGITGTATVSVIPTTNVPLSQDVTITITDDALDAFSTSTVSVDGETYQYTYTTIDGYTTTSSEVVRLLSDGTVLLQSFPNEDDTDSDTEE